MLPIQKNTATAALRRVFMLIYSDTDHVTPWAGSVTGVKAQLSWRGLNSGGSAGETASSADITRVNGALHYVELTQAESNISTGVVIARVAAASGRDEGVGTALIVNYDGLEPGATAADIRSEIDANSSMLAGIRTDTEDLQSRVPAALVSGRIDASVGAMAANVVTASAVAADAVTELQSGLATAASLATSDGKLDTLLGADVVYKKNVAVTAFGFYMENTDGTPGTGKTVTFQVSKDGAAFATVAGSVSEISGGFYRVDLSQSEMNADEILIKATATGCRTTAMKIRTQA